MPPIGQEKTAFVQFPNADGTVLANVTDQTEAIEQKHTEAGCFILITNRPFLRVDHQIP